jgi:flagellar biosynthesis chaperone FliJ
MLKIRKEIECYDNVMELRPNYPKILYNLGFRIEKKAKEYIHKSKVINKKRRKLNEKVMELVTYLINRMYERKKIK